MRERQTKTVYAFDIPSADFYDAFITKEDVITALMEEHKPYHIYNSFDHNNMILCYETEQQCLDAYDAFHKQLPSATYIGRGEVKVYDRT